MIKTITTMILFFLFSVAMSEEYKAASEIKMKDGTYKIKTWVGKDESENIALYYQITYTKMRTPSLYMINEVTWVSDSPIPKDVKVIKLPDILPKD